MFDPLAFGVGAVVQQVGEAEDAGQRGADLVRDDLDRGAEPIARLTRPIALGPEPPFQVGPRAHVLQRQEHPLSARSGGAERDERQAVDRFNGSFAQADPADVARRAPERRLQDVARIRPP